jgi:cobalt/nickel transport system permease protein
MASDYSDPAARQQIAAASLHHAAPRIPPRGLQRLSSVWTAPFARYAPPYIRGAAFGYILSALFGAGLIVLACLLLGHFMRSAARAGPGAV